MNLSYSWLEFFFCSRIFQGADRIIKLWDAYTGQIIQTLEGHILGISDIAWSYDTEYIASASDDKTIRIWSLDLVGNSNSYYYVSRLIMLEIRVLP